MSAYGPDGQPSALRPADVSQLRVELTLALRLAARHAFTEGIDNHFSVAVDDQHFLINSYGRHWSEIRPDDILLVDTDGAVLAGSGHWDQAAFTIHHAAHRARADARVAFHTHMPYATTVSCTPGLLDTQLTQAAMLFHGRVASVPYDGLATTPAEGERLTSLLTGDADVVLMRNHGVLVVAQSVAAAWHRLYMLERACQVQVAAYSLSAPPERASADVAAKTERQWQAVAGETATLLFDAEVRCLIRDDPAVARWSSPSAAPALQLPAAR